MRRLLCASRRPLAFLAAAVAIVLHLTPQAAAHAVLIQSTPPRDAMLAEPPREIRLQFNARIEQRVTHVTLRRGETPIVPLEVAPADAANRLTILVPPLEAGVYTLRYKVLATDGHLTEGVVRFTVLKR